ncbi:prepilin-type N-terminal cleavage/methylation domain-containing protein [Roseivivax sp. THAF30]|uniref:prepilin-type N-terminal cleavage/methylation domain-containing protein n=1 Tax=Roseivivax sp. THAF30 TaxID=2587852 RepID=UPI0012AAB8FD|nr:prepilin-type N-terminal cleavage/methylation domain-containing protein [Roseivivax sp. THAF30]QFT61972.1 hypothetical protein FIU91_03440 [Roseivivax sp. THAF30]
MRPARAPDAGFTLIEALVAMTVLGFGAATLLTAAERHAAETRGLADRIVARWVAENALVSVQLGFEMRAEWSTALGQEIDTNTERRALGGSGLVEVRIVAGPPGDPLVTLVGYLPDGAAQ